MCVCGCVCVCVRVELAAISLALHIAAGPQAFKNRWRRRTLYLALSVLCISFCEETNVRMLTHTLTSHIHCLSITTSVVVIIVSCTSLPSVLLPTEWRTHSLRTEVHIYIYIDLRQIVYRLLMRATKLSSSLTSHHLLVVTCIPVDQAVTLYT